MRAFEPVESLRFLAEAGITERELIRRGEVAFALVVLPLAGIGACSSDAFRSATSPSAAGTSSAAQGTFAHMITGTGLAQQMPGLVYRNTIDARLTQDGQVSGKLTVNLIDLSAFGIEGGQATLQGDITCLSFDDDAVWFGGVIRSSSRPEYLDPPLAETIGVVKKINGQDYLFSGPAVFYVAPGTTCLDHPELPIRPTTNGTFNIK